MNMLLVAQQESIVKIEGHIDSGRANMEAGSSEMTAAINHRV
jgi:t-SNARE complex subunit (syntaxin)